MKKLFTMIAVVAFLAACGGNAGKKAKAVEDQKAEIEAVVDTCNAECKAECTGECTEGEKCCKGEAEGEAIEKKAATEGTAEI